MENISPKEDDMSRKYTLRDKRSESEFIAMELFLRTY